MDGTINTQSNQVNHVKLTHNTTVIRSCSYYYNKIKKLHTNTTVHSILFMPTHSTPAHHHSNKPPPNRTRRSSSSFTEDERSIKYTVVSVRFTSHSVELLFVV